MMLLNTDLHGHVSVGVWSCLTERAPEFPGLIFAFVFIHVYPLPSFISFSTWQVGKHKPLEKEIAFLHASTEHNFKEVLYCLLVWSCSSYNARGLLSSLSTRWQRLSFYFWFWFCFLVSYEG